MHPARVALHLSAGFDRAAHYTLVRPSYVSASPRTTHTNRPLLGGSVVLANSMSQENSVNAQLAAPVAPVVVRVVQCCSSLLQRGHLIMQNVLRNG